MSKKPLAQSATRDMDSHFEVTIHRHEVKTIQVRICAATSKDALRLAQASASEHQKLFDQTDAHSCSFQALGARTLPEPAVRLAVSNGD